MGGIIAHIIGDIPSWTVKVWVLGLMGFAAIVLMAARRSSNHTVKAIIVADESWVATGLILIMLLPTWLASSGFLLILAIATVVATFAVVHGLGLVSRTR